MKAQLVGSFVYDGYYFVEFFLFQRIHPYVYNIVHLIYNNLVMFLVLVELYHQTLQHLLYIFRIYQFFLLINLSYQSKLYHYPAIYQIDFYRKNIVQKYPFELGWHID